MQRNGRKKMITTDEQKIGHSTHTSEARDEDHKKLQSQLLELHLILDED